MRISFLLPSWPSAPSGGAKVVYEYANRLVRRGHTVAIVHPLYLNYRPPEPITTRQLIRSQLTRVRGLFSHPSIRWHPIDQRVTMLLVPNSHEKHIPDADVLFATGWDTVASIQKCGSRKGTHCYLIQGYETWRGNKDMVDATWRLPIDKIVIARWLKELGEQLGSDRLTYIPNAIDHSQYHITKSIQNRPRRVAMAFSRSKVKASEDGIRALVRAKEKFSDLEAVFFSTDRPDSSIPKWIEFNRNPPQNFIVSQILNASSIFLNPSLSEGWSLPATEAAACGCAIVSTDNGGIREYVEHDVSGLLSPPKDAEALTHNLCQLLEDDQARIRIAKAGGSAVRQLCWDRSVDLLEAFCLRVSGLERRHCGGINKSNS
jgi:glycosyltransferase involved in cell wall biosynthesis